jgi:hypothetical protein
MSDLKFAYRGEAQLVRWAESGNAGRTVTLRLDEEGDVHPFKGLKQGDNGVRMQVAIVLVDDQEKPMVPPSGGSKKEAGKKAFRDMPRSQQAALKLTDPDFREWLEQYNDGPEKLSDYDFTLKQLLVIDSKRELDTNPGAAERWDRVLATYDARSFIR